METKRKDIKYQIQQGYKLQTIMHYVNRETLIKQHEKQQKNKASGIDGMTKEKYGENLDYNIDKFIKKNESIFLSTTTCKENLHTKIKWEVKRAGNTLL